MKYKVGDELIRPYEVRPVARIVEITDTEYILINRNKVELRKRIDELDNYTYVRKVTKLDKILE